MIGGVFGCLLLGAMTYLKQDLGLFTLSTCFLFFFLKDRKTFHPASRQSEVLIPQSTHHSVTSYSPAFNFTYGQNSEDTVTVFLSY